MAESVSLSGNGKRLAFYNFPKKVRCKDCGYESEPHGAPSPWIVCIGSIEFKGCPNCMGLKLKEVLGTTTFGDLEDCA